MAVRVGGQNARKKKLRVDRRRFREVKDGFEDWQVVLCLAGTWGDNLLRDIGWDLEREGKK